MKLLCPKCGKPLCVGRACPGFVPFAFCMPPMTAKSMEQQISETVNRCEYFNGISNDTCKAGVSYDRG